MSQNSQEYPRTGTDLQSLSVSGDAPGQVDTLKIVACPICRAVYVPSSASCRTSALLETAFLDVCHFCFRCQRPACPQCWNPVHQTCASCSEEANLPFRSPVPSLEGLIFLPLTTTSTSSAYTISFTCQRNGRFYTPDPALRTIPQNQTILSTSVSKPVMSDTLSTLSSAHPIPAAATNSVLNTSHHPAWLQEAFGQPVNEYANFSRTCRTQTYACQESTNGQHIVSDPASTFSPAQTNWPQFTTLAQTQVTSVRPPAIPPPAPVPTASLSPNQEIIPEMPRQEESESEDFSLTERVENALIVITSILLLTVVLMLVLSLCFVQVNTFFLGLLHIDIRTEIAYLLQLR